MLRIPPSLAAAAFAGLFAACTPPVPETGPLPVAGVPVQAWRSQLDNQQSRVVYVRNDTDQPMLITSFQIYSCVNVRQDCTTYNPDIAVPPHQAVIAMRVDPIRAGSEPIFGYTYKWQHVAGNAARAISTPCGQLSAGMPCLIRVQTAPPTPLADVEQFKPAVGPLDRGGTCSPSPVGAFTPGGSVLMMVFGPVDRPFRQLRLELDSLGKPYSYSDGRGDLRSPPGATDPTTPPSGLRTTIGINVPFASATMENEGNGMARESYFAQGPEILRAVSLGVPQQMIERIVRECGRR